MGKIALMELREIRDRWNDVLDALLDTDRIAWLAFFDARLADFDGTTLTLDFSDSRKLGAAHEYSAARIKQRQLLISIIKELLNIDVEIAEK
ncbi:unannotated protein [freshwater metagenome]|uniref:Unannotated protein n=1 Tax=freshwater metagenome TaxID=449393 RepID=A0A6J7AJA0_9ZZZZ